LFKCKTPSKLRGVTFCYLIYLWALV